MKGRSKNKRRRNGRKTLFFQGRLRSLSRSGRGGRRFKSYHSDQHLAHPDRAIPTVSPTDLNASGAHTLLRGSTPRSTRGGTEKKCEQPNDRKCGARTRAGSSCERPAIRGRIRCRLHGRLSPGAPRGSKNGNFKTGDWTAEAIKERQWPHSLVRSFAIKEQAND